MLKPKKTHVEPVFKDGRGEILSIMTESVHHVGITTFTKGATRGKHYHKVSDQLNYVLEGKIEIIIKNMREKDSDPKTILLEKGDMITVPAYWYHELRGIEESILLFSETGPRQTSEEYEKDTYRVPKL